MAKVNLKNKYGEFEPHLEDIICFLKERLAESQKNKIPSETSKIQEQIWTMKDFQAGYLNGINEKHLEDVFSLFRNSIKENEINENEKKLKNLLKKREQIKILIERQTKGEKLEINQIEKIKNLDKVEDEIENLQNLLNK